MEKLNYPWIAPVLGRLPKLAAALLLAGPEGLGKRETARYLAHAVLCEKKRTHLDPCGECPSCLLLAAGTHPDLRVLEVGQQEEAGESAQGEEEGSATAKKA